MSEGETSSPEIPYSILSGVFLTISLGFIIVTTIIGNVLVCVSVCFVRRLRRPSNYLLVSLAVSDLCVAVLVMPLALHVELTGMWTLGDRMCDVWIALDMTCCTASILNLCAISVDRYFTISKPLTYGVNKKARWVWLSIAVVWLAASGISVPPMITLGNEYGTDSEPRCDVSQNVAYQLYATLGSFYIPLIVIMLMYCKIYVTARSIVKSEKVTSPSERFYCDGMPATTTITGNAIVSPKVKVPQPKRDCSKEVLTKSPEENDSGRKKTSNRKSKAKGDSGVKKVYNFKRKGSSRCHLDPAVDHYTRRSTNFTGSPSGAHNSPRNYARSRMAAVLKERKASFTLGIILAAFTMCWLPFFVVALLRAVLKDMVPVSDTAKKVVLWLGYANSMLNPVIYVTFHKDFRKSFKEIICFRCWTVNEVFRQEASKAQCQRAHWKSRYS